MACDINELTKMSLKACRNVNISEVVMKCSPVRPKTFKYLPKEPGTEAAE
jgi:hypothetical protein